MAIFTPQEADREYISTLAKNLLFLPGKSKKRIEKENVHELELT